MILATLVGQGLTLGPLIRWLRRARTTAPRSARRSPPACRLAEAAIARVEELDGADWVRADTLERVRGLYDYRRRRFGARSATATASEYEERTGAYIRLMYELLRRPARGADRAAQPAARSRDEVRRRVERDLDLEESRLLGWQPEARRRDPP